MSALLRRGIIDSGGNGGFFRTSLYSGTAVQKDVITGFDFVNNDGLVWIKSRDSNTYNNNLFDTKRGATNFLRTNSNATNSTDANRLNQFNDDGFSVGTSTQVNDNGDNLVAWQWIVEEGFFDIVEYVGDGSAQNAIPHSLNEEVGHLMIKAIDRSTAWASRTNTIGVNSRLTISSNNPQATTEPTTWNSTLPTSTEFTVGSNLDVNRSGDNFIAYLWAHNPSKGIYCGGYDGTGAIGNKIVTGFPVSFVLIKINSGGLGDWHMVDKARNNTVLNANTQNAEAVSAAIEFNIDGFTVNETAVGWNALGDSHVFIAIK